MKGSLSPTYGLADAIRGIYVGRRSGILAVERAGVRKQIYFHRGSIDFSDTSEPGWRFGELLVRRGKLQAGDLDSVLRLLGPGRRIGRVLCELGYLDEAGLAEAVSWQITENIYPVFSWVEGDFAFTEKEAPTPSDIAFEMSTANVILEGVRRIADSSFVRSAVGPVDQVVSLGSNPLLRFQSVFLRPKEGFVLSRIDGILTIDEVCSISPVPEEEVLRCLYGLKCAGILEISSREAVQRSEEEGDIAGFFTDFAGVEQILGAPAAAATGSRSELTPEEERERQEIVELAGRLQELDHYQILGVQPNAELKVIRKAYYALAKRFHPDRHHKSHLANLQDRLEAVFVRVNEAYETLKDERSRASYDRVRSRAGAAGSRDAGAGGSAAPAADPVADAQRRAAMAEASFREGRTMFEQGDWFGAIRAFQIAVQQVPDKAAYRSWLGRTLGKNPKWRRDAEEHLLKAIELEPSVAEHYAQLGAIYEAASLRSRADRYFEEALKWDPHNETALLALARRQGGEGGRAAPGRAADKVRSLFGGKDRDRR